MIKNKLEEKKLSMRKLSQITEIDVATISRIINGKQNANLTHLKKIAFCLDISLNRLLEAAGHRLDTEDSHEILNVINETLKALNLEDQGMFIQRIRDELDKYEAYAKTPDGEALIHHTFLDKLLKANGNGAFIKTLEDMYEQYKNASDIQGIKSILGSGLLYFILAADVIPDYLFPFGYLDDLIAINLVNERIIHNA